MYTQYAVEVFDGLPKPLEGFGFLATDTIYIPYLRTDLLITKRVAQGISVIEEYMLKFIDAGVEQIDEICGVMGLRREFIEITIADLYGKDYITHSAQKCHITQPGRKILEDLKETKNETDTLGNIYLNLITSDIAKDKKGLIKECPLHRYKLSTKIEMDQYLIEFKKRIPELKQIFQQWNAENTTSKNEQELVNIVKISNDKIWFLPIKINIYISNDNQSIDILSFDPDHKSLVGELKHIIIDDIMNVKLLSDVVCKTPISITQNDGAILQENDQLLSMIRNQIQVRNEVEISNDFEDLILTPRKLFCNEITPFLKIIMRNAQKIVLSTSGNIKKKLGTPESISILQILCDCKDFQIHYKFSHNIKKDFELLRNSIPELKLDMFVDGSNIIDDFSIQINDTYILERKKKTYAICGGLFATQEEYYLSYASQPST